MRCDGGTTDTTHEQRRELERIRAMVDRVLNEAIRAFPHERAWKDARRAWNGTVAMSTNPRTAEFAAPSGCLIVGLHGSVGEINARALLALSKAATNNARCTTLHSALLGIATGPPLNVPVALDCDVAEQHAFRVRAQCPGCEWLGGAPETCHATKRMVWPEFLGVRASDVLAWFRKNYPGVDVEAASWDSLDVMRPSSKGSIRVTVDAATGLVVAPPPHRGTMNVPTDPEFNCFSKPDAESNMRCIGAPVPPSPAGWEVYVGQLVTSAVDDLRARYPHAAVEYIPSTASVSDDLRADRIRVIFDSETGKVVAVPTVG